jgi:Flp pilus assembly protein TadG
MRKGTTRLWARVRGFTRCERGTAMMEFTLVFPMLVVLFLGLVEFGEAFSINRRMAYTATTSADLVSQVSSVTNADLADITLAIDELVKPHSTTPFGMIISSVYTDAVGTTKVDWSYATGSGVTAHATGAVYTLPAGLKENGYSMVVVETKYVFTPTVGLFLLGSHTMNGTAYARPRLSSKITKTS